MGRVWLLTASFREQAVRNRGVVRCSNVRASRAAGFSLPDPADDLGWPAGAKEFQDAGPVGHAVGADDAAGAIAEQRGAV